MIKFAYYFSEDVIKGWLLSSGEKAENKKPLVISGHYEVISGD